MSRARSRAAICISAILLGAAALAGCDRSPAHQPPRAESEKPTLLLLTSLPLVFGEQFSLEGGGSPALKALESRYRVVPISVTSPSDLGKGRLLLMAHPLAQTAENLVALDRWVRAGGRVLLLADPMLEWPSERPLGDPLRPPPMFMDTGLLRHWGLRLDSPDERGPRAGQLGGYEIATESPGSLFGGCEISSDRLVAHCRIGKGRATIVADADWLDVELVDGSGARNLEALLGELSDLESPRVAFRVGK
jgi:hypothetical protein